MKIKGLIGGLYQKGPGLGVLGFCPLRSDTWRETYRKEEERSGSRGG